MIRGRVLLGPAVAVLAVMLLGSLFLAAGCSMRPLLYDVQVSPTSISPNADGEQDVTLISYRLSRSATLSIYFDNEAGERFFFRQERRRSQGQYNVYWGGAIEGEALYQTEHAIQLVTSRVLPDGAYRWTIEARDDAGRRRSETGTIELVDSDTTVPELQNFSVSPQAFTPNQDGIDDRVAITYYLSKEADVRVYLVGPDEYRYPVGETERAVKPGEVGLHLYDYDAGIDDKADPPPDGTYTVVAEAEDRVGSRVVVSNTLTIQEGGVPRADIVQANVEFEPKIVPLGGTLYFTATVENIGTVPIRTSGPPAGTPYRSDQNFNGLEWYEEPGVFRFGIDFETNSTGRPYPYRYAIGGPDSLTVRVIDGREYRYLLPGQRAVITGSIQLNDQPPRNPIYFWGGLIHEDVRIEAYNDHVDPQQISVGF